MRDAFHGPRSMPWTCQPWQESQFDVAVAEGGIKQGQRVQSITVAGNTTRRPGRALADQAVAACAAAGLESISGGLRGRGRRKTKERGESSCIVAEVG
jgi:hypothetical protein